MSRYEFALLRYVHDASAGEFANIGLIMFDADSARLLVRATERYGRLSRFFGEINGGAYRTLVRHAERALSTVEESLRQPDVVDPPPTSLADALARALPDPDGCLRASEIMYGVHDDPDQRFLQLYQEFIGRYELLAERDRREEEDIRRDFTQRVIRSDVGTRVVLDYELHGPNYSHKFAAGWRNGRPQVLDAVSFDMVDASRIVEKANLWTGRLVNLSKGSDFMFTGVVAPPTLPTLGRAFDRAVTILRTSPNVRRIVMESDADQAIRQIREDTSHDDEMPVD